MRYHDVFSIEKLLKHCNIILLSFIARFMMIKTEDVYLLHEENTLCYPKYHILPYTYRPRGGICTS